VEEVVNETETEFQNATFALKETIVMCVPLAPDATRVLSGGCDHRSSCGTY
jgi:hypothetical protein